MSDANERLRNIERRYDELASGGMVRGVPVWISEDPPPFVSPRRNGHRAWALTWAIADALLTVPADPNPMPRFHLFTRRSHE